MAKRQDIGTLVDDESTPAELKQKLERAKAIREFAIEELALPDDGSYRSYVDVGRPLRYLERGRHAGSFIEAEDLVLPGDRLRVLPWVFRGERRA